jgi:PAS domain S-box-containing protein
VSKSEKLREKAQRILEQRGKVTPDYANDLEALIEELNIYQIELEEQNRNLQETQLQLEENRRQYKDLFENAPIGYFILNEKMEIIKLNNIGAKLLLQNHNTILSSKFSKFIAPNSQDDFYLHFSKVIKSEIRDRCEITLKNDETELQVRIESVFVPSDKSGMKTVKMTVEDITELSEMYEKINLSEQKYRTIFENSGDGFLVLTDKIEDANHQAANIYGYSIEELIGMHPGKDLSPEIQPNGKKSIEEAPKKIKAAIEEGIQKFYWQHITKDGYLIDTEITLGLYTSQKEPKIIAVVRDITAQKKYEALLQQKNAEIAAQNIEYGELNQELSETVNLLKVANKEIAESEGKFRNYMETSPTAIVILNHENTATYANTSAGILTGYLDDSKSHFNACFEINEKNKKFLEDIQIKGRINNFKTTIKNNSGRLKHVLINANRIEYNQIIMFLSDITKQEQLDKLVFKEKEQWRRTFQAVSEGILLSDTNYTIMLCNPAFAKIVNYDKPEELIGSKTHYVIHGSHNPVEDCHLCKAHKQKKVTVSNEYEPHLNKHLNSTSIPVFNENNEVDFFVTTIQDVTSLIETEKELKYNETRLNLAIESAYEGMWDWNIKTGDVIFNHIWAEMLGYSLDEIEPNLNTWDKLLHPDDREHTMKALQKHLDGKIDRYESEHRLKTKSGEYKWILDRGKVIEWDENDKPLRAIGTHLDISRQKEIENELKEAKEKAENADKLKTAFLANMSHEIRTPMNGIVGFTELLRKKNFNTEKRNRIFNIIQSSSKQLLQLINDIVDISKIESNQLNIYYEKFYIDDLLNELFEITMLSLQKLQKDQNIDLILDLPDKNNPLEIYSSIGRLRQTISNLVNNAIKFTERGHITIGYKKTDNDFIEIFVEDTGIGISDEGKKIIFDRFMQATTETARNYGGTGLGLFITKQLVMMLNGQIHLESEEYKGSKFTIKIPIQLNENQATQQTISDNFQ